MRRNKKPIGRWIGEAILIFLSVLGAFYIDSYREAKNEEENYLRTLRDFKADLEVNQGKFNYELNTTYNQENGQGYIQGNIKKLEKLDSLMSNPNRQNAEEIIVMLEGGAVNNLTPWIFISPQYDKLQTQYYSFIQGEKLRERLQMHYRANTSRIKLKTFINEYVQVFRDIEDGIRKEDGASVVNRNVLFDVITMNKIRRIKNGYISLKNSTESARESDMGILEGLEEELKLWGLE